MIHFIWSGFGFLVVVITFGASLVAQLLTNSITGSGAYWLSHKWPLSVSLFISAVTCWFVGGYFRNRKARRLIDPETGKEVVLRQSHTLFLIPIKWWAPILAFFGVMALYKEFAK